MYKKYCISVLAVVLSVLLVISSVVFFVDPFCHYRVDPDIEKIIYQMPYYQNVGIAKHAKYDTLITGTSMTQNFLANKFNDLFGCNAIRLSFDGGIISDFTLLLNTALDNNPQLKRIYFGLDNYLLTDDTLLTDVTERTPDYLADDNVLNDVKYLLNKDVIFKYMRVHFAYKYSESYDFYKMHAWDNGSIVTSREKVLENYSFPQEKLKLNSDYFYNNVDTATDELLKIVKNNLNTEFVFFAPPYSILYWHTQKVEGKLDATISALERCYSKLLDYKNVRLFYFQNEFDLITDLDQYKDFSHYLTKYNDYMMLCFKNGKNEVTMNNLKLVLNDMKNFAENYEYDELFK